MTLAFIVGDKLSLAVIVGDGYGCVAFKFICISFILRAPGRLYAQALDAITMSPRWISCKIPFASLRGDFLWRSLSSPSCLLRLEGDFPVIMLMLFERWLSDLRWIWIWCWRSCNTLSFLHGIRNRFFMLMNWCTSVVCDTASSVCCSSTYDVVKCWLLAIRWEKSKGAKRDTISERGSEERDAEEFQCASQCGKREREQDLQRRIRQFWNNQLRRGGTSRGEFLSSSTHAVCAISAHFANLVSVKVSTREAVMDFFFLANNTNQLVIQ